MINITIKPAVWHAAGFLRATGHAGTAPAGQDLLCAAVTALVDGLAANLQAVHGVSVSRKAENGAYVLRWTREKGVDGLKDANSAAWHAYVALRALAKEYPEAVKAAWVKQEYYSRH